MLECKYCRKKVNKIINYCGTGICMDCNDRLTHRGKYAPKEQISESDRQKRISWMHRETYIDEKDFYNDQENRQGKEHLLKEVIQ